MAVSRGDRQTDGPARFFFYIFQPPMRTALHWRLIEAATEAEHGHHRQEGLWLLFGVTVCVFPRFRPSSRGRYPLQVASVSQQRVGFDRYPELQELHWPQLPHAPSPGPFKGCSCAYSFFSSFFLLVCFRSGSCATDLRSQSRADWSVVLRGSFPRYHLACSVEGSRNLLCYVGYACK
ncbi:hypothetical protein EV127DRAFT_56501 [Xylaria flabelliformis]|nr:hypothetical protein EV127DRAFT_56501 [Xylaria flabelliformis]